MGNLTSGPDVDQIGPDVVAVASRRLSPSVCLSHGAAAVDYRHAGCLQLSHVRTVDPSAD